MVSFAQKRERIQALKVAHITEKLDLSSEEAQKFWPVYNAHEKKMHKIRKQEREEIFKVLKENKEDLTEAQANSLIEKDLSLKEEKLKLHKALVKNLRGVIPAKKILRLKKAEDDFKRMLLDRVKRKHRSGTKGEHRPK
jgi:hypothetical protein